MANDLHLLLSRADRRLKLFDAGGTLLYTAEARNRTVNDLAPPNQRWAPCPAGEFILGRPVRKATAPFGPFFIPLLDGSSPPHVMAENSRSGIGLHGGGSGLAEPFAPAQSPPWVPTHGCWRLLNRDLLWLVGRLQVMTAHGGACRVTVEPWTPAVPGAAEDDVLEIEESRLDPEE